MKKKVAKRNTRRKLSEGALIADQLRRAFDGNAWHGPALLELLEDVDATAAAAKPLPDVHSIWELVLHIRAWDNAGLRRLAGETAKLKGNANFPLVPTSPTEDAWQEAVAATAHTHETLVEAIEGLSSKRLSDRVPGKPYNFAHMFNGIAQHELYHAGQIAILKKVTTS